LEADWASRGFRFVAKEEEVDHRVRQLPLVLSMSQVEAGRGSCFEPRHCLPAARDRRVKQAVGRWDRDSRIHRLSGTPGGPHAQSAQTAQKRNSRLAVPLDQEDAEARRAMIKLCPRPSRARSQDRGGGACLCAKAIVHSRAERARPARAKCREAVGISMSSGGFKTLLIWLEISLRVTVVSCC